jgi:hypothetical protein
MHGLSLDDLDPPREPATTGFPFPLPILLVRVNAHETDFADLLEGTLVQVVEAFDTDAIIGRRFETVMIAWTHYAMHDDSALREDTRRQLVDWINLHVVPRTREGRRPIWL